MCLSIKDWKQVERSLTDYSKCNTVFFYMTESCSPGEYYSLSQESCMSCPLGNYQSGGGLFYCIPCPLGRTTISVKSTSSEQCIGKSNTTAGLSQYGLAPRYSCV